MSVHCKKCNAEVAEHEVDACIVNRQDIEDVPEAKLQLGDIVCCLCWHTLKWPPPSLEEGYDDDRYGGGVL
jgi:hypothetical protein